MINSVDPQAALADNEALIQQVEAQLTQPDAEGMQMLQSMLGQPTPAGDVVSTVSGAVAEASAAKLAGSAVFTPDPSVAGQQGSSSSAMFAANSLAANASQLTVGASTLSMTSAAAAAAPAALGKSETVAEQVALAGKALLPEKALDGSSDLSLPKLLQDAAGLPSAVPPLQALAGDMPPTAAELSLMQNLLQAFNGSPSDPAALNQAIDQISQQIELLPMPSSPIWGNSSLTCNHRPLNCAP